MLQGVIKENYDSRLRHGSVVPCILPSLIISDGFSRKSQNVVTVQFFGQI